MRVLAGHNISSRASGNHLFVVIGAQRTGTNLLREILNTNERIAMLGEVLTPSPAPAHWDNYCRAFRLAAFFRGVLATPSHASTNTLNLYGIAFAIIGKAIRRATPTLLALISNTSN